MPMLQRSEDNLQESVLTFRHVGPWDCTQLGSRHLYRLSRVTSPSLSRSICSQVCSTWLSHVLSTQPVWKLKQAYL